MTRHLADREGGEPLRTLRSVRRIQPDSRATHQAIERALAAAQGESAKSRRITWKRIVMRGSLAAAILIVIVTAGWLVTSGPNLVAAPTWDDLARQTSGIDKVYIDARMYQGAKLTQRNEIWIKSPGIIRSREYEVVDGKMVPTECSIATPTAAVRWDERTRLGEYTSTSNRYMMQSSVAGTFEAILGISLLANVPESSVKINEQQVTLKPVEQKHPEDAGLRGFKLEKKSATGPELMPPFNSLVYWFAAKSNTLCRLTMTTGEGNEAQRMEMKVTFDPAVPADWFDVKLPPDCFDVAAGVRPRLSPEVREVYDKVTAARKRFGDYRAVIWRDQTGGWPSFREATRDGQWRCDNIQWTVMHSAQFEGNRQGYVKISPEDPFEKLWGQVNRDDYKLSVTAMTWDGKLAFVNYGQRAAQLQGALQSGYEKFFAPAFLWTAWPEWMWWENLEPHGWDLRNQPFQWRLGPANQEHPEWVNVVGERPKGSYTVVRYSFDPGKDWLCVRQEWETNPTDNITWELTDFGRTADGLWYPTQATILGQHYDYAVQRSSGEPAFFDYPKGMPQPTDPFAEMMAKVDQATATAAAANAPPTAKGRYLAIGARGLPRGFDDKANSEANSEMVQKMDYISHRINEFAHEHKWVFPKNLPTLVEEGYLKPEDLHNPLHPDADPPFGYIRPSRKPIDGPERLVLYEPFTEWPGVVAVVFQDHSVEYIHDKAQFEKLLREATAPEPPSRPSGE